MMGEGQIEQDSLFYQFSLVRHDPAGHILRAIDRFVDLEEVRAHVAPFYSPIGRPSIDPELLIACCWWATASASARSGGCARRSTSSLPTAGSAGWGWRTTCPTPPRRHRLETAQARQADPAPALKPA